jgi:tetratricopeptide (TPR) repeat protein
VIASSLEDVGRTCLVVVTTGCFYLDYCEELRVSDNIVTAPILETEKAEVVDPTGLCACNSGLTAGHCCSFDPATAAPPEATAHLVPAVEAAERALHTGDRDGAIRLAIDVLEQAPRRPHALAVLAEARLGQRRPRAARALLERLMEIDPGNFWPINKLGLLELGRGNVDAAEPLARRGIRLAPENPQAHNLMGMAMTELNRAVVGEYHCRKALELLDTRPALVLANLATNLVNQGRIDEARILYQEADAAVPDNRQTLLAWARMEEADRKFAAAHALLDRLDTLFADDAAVALTRAMTLGREKRYDDAIATIEASAARHTRALSPSEMLERGRLLDRLGRYDDAWADFMAGKAGSRTMSGNVYDEAQQRATAERLKYFFRRKPLSLMPAVAPRNDVAQPIFILGFPRSGTTLLEQTLSASPIIAAGDELPLVHQIAAITPRLLASPLEYPEALSDLWMGDKRDGLAEMRDHYLQRARHLGVMPEGARFFTDKMPLNETHLGLIGLMFPQAPLLHVIRHPLDIMVSAMSNIFTHGGFCGTTLESAAKHLVLAHELVAHYRQEMDLRYRAVRYEDVVHDQEATIRGAFDFIDVPFDPAVLGFEANARYARTASYAQVTEKLYDRSAGRYRHYLPHLAPVVPILEPLIERLGYTIAT